MNPIDIDLAMKILIGVAIIFVFALLYSEKFE